MPILTATGGPDAVFPKGFVAQAAHGAKRIVNFSWHFLSTDYSSPELRLVSDFMAFLRK